MKILFLIRSLNRGGAETQLVHLAAGLARLGHETVVATFYPEWTMGKSLSEHGVRLISLDKKGRWDVAFFLHRLTRLVRTEKPDVLHAYMTTANVLAAFLKPLLRHHPLSGGCAQPRSRSCVLTASPHCLYGLSCV